MPQPLVITGNIDFSGDCPSIRDQVCDRPFWLTCDMDVQALDRVLWESNQMVF